MRPAALAAALALVACAPDDAALDAAPPDAALDAAAEAAPTAYVIHLAPDGDDTRDGLDPAAPIATLRRAHDLVTAADPQLDVELRIAPGLYLDQRVVWTRTHPDFDLRIRPTDPDDRPIFDGCTPDGTCLGGVFFQLEHARGEDSNVDIEGIQVQYYQRAIYLHGDRDTLDGYNAANRVADCVFFNIGNVYNLAVGNAFGAVTLVNSRDNIITGNRFVRMLTYFEYGLMHAVYLAHHSHTNLIEANHFEIVSGDAVRLRDDCDDNTIIGNTFIKAGEVGVGEFYCDHDTRDDCTKPDPECPSWGTLIEDNTLDGSWSRCDPIPAAGAYQDDDATGCFAPAEAERFILGDNPTPAESACEPGIDPVEPPADALE